MPRGPNLFLKLAHPSQFLAYFFKHSLGILGILDSADTLNFILAGSTLYAAMSTTSPRWLFIATRYLIECDLAIIRSAVYTSAFLISCLEPGLKRCIAHNAAVARGQFRFRISCSNWASSSTALPTPSKCGERVTGSAAASRNVLGEDTSWSSSGSSGDALTAYEPEGTRSARIFPQ